MFAIPVNMKLINKIVFTQFYLAKKAFNFDGNHFKY